MGQAVKNRSRRTKLAVTKPPEPTKMPTLSTMQPLVAQAGYSRQSSPRRRNWYRWIAQQIANLSLVITALAGLLAVLVRVDAEAVRETYNKFAALVVGPSAEPPLPTTPVAPRMGDQPAVSISPPPAVPAPPAIRSETAHIDAARAQPKLAETGAGPQAVVRANGFQIFKDRFVYYEVSKDGRRTSAGVLGYEDPMAPLGDFKDVKSGAVLRSYGYMRVREGPTAGSQRIDTLRPGECVEVVADADPDNAAEVRIARSGGWLQVTFTSCTDTPS